MAGGFRTGNQSAEVGFVTLTLAVANLLTIQIGGANRGGEYDALTAIGDVVLGGSLSALLIDVGDGQFLPFAGDAFEIIRSATGLTGEFSGISLLPSLQNDLAWHFEYDRSALRVLLEVVTPYSADFDGNGRVDGDDLGSSYDAITLFEHPEADGDGRTGGKDFLAWQRRLGSGVDDGATANNAPEPVSAALLLTAVLSLRIRTTVSNARCVMPCCVARAVAEPTAKRTADSSSGCSALCPPLGNRTTTCWSC